MKTVTFCIRCAAALLALLLPLQAAAVEFVFVGSRQIGMGGAGVATTTDSLATYWNPAGMAMSKKFDIRIQGSGQFVDRGDVFDTLKDINRLNLNDTSAGNRRTPSASWSIASTGREPI